MLSTFAIVIAGVSLIIVVVSMYRNSPNPVPIIDIERGANGIIEIQTTKGANPPFDPNDVPFGTTFPKGCEVAIVDSELNLIV